MKFSISADKFFNAINKLNYVVPGGSHTTLPILSNIYFNLTGNNLRLVSTDLESFITTDIKVDGKKDGGAAVPARKLLDLLKAMLIKNNFVKIGTAFSADNFDILTAGNLLPDIEKFNIKYDTSSGKFVYNGAFPEDNFENVLSAFEDMKNNYGSISDPALADAAKAFSALLENMKTEAINAFHKETDKMKIAVEANEKFKVTITYAKGKYNFFGEPIEDFPLPDDKQDLAKIEMQGGTLKKYLQKIKHSIKNDEIRRNMAGVFFDFDIPKSELKLVATDGYRLSKIVTNDYNPSIEKNETFILPLKTVDLLPRVLPDNSISMEFDSSMIVFKTQELHIYSKLIDDSFPNYESVIPTDSDKKLTVNRYELISALRRASIFTDKVTRKVKFEINGNELVIRADNPEIGSEGEENINCTFKKIDGKEITDAFTIAFNIEYLLQCVTQIESDEITIDLSTPSKATIVKSYMSGGSEDYTELIMPIRVG